MTVTDAIRIIFRYRRNIILTFLTVLTAVAAVTFLMKPVYEAKASLLVKMLKEDSSRPRMTPDDGSLPLTLTQDEIINTEIQIITGRELTQKVITALQVARIYPAIAANAKNEAAMMDQAVRAFQSSLKVYGVRKSNVITISFQHTDPQIAAKAVNLLVDDFQAKHLELHSDPQSSFIGTEVSDLKQKLNSSQKELQEYEQNHRAFSLDEQRSLLLNQRVQLDSSYKIAAAAIKELGNKAGVLKSKLRYMTANSSQYTHSERDKIITDAQAKLLELKLKEQELRRKYTENNRLVVEVKRQEEMVHGFMQDQEQNIVAKVKSGNPVYQNMEMDLFRAEAELNSQVARANVLKGQLAKLDREIAALDMSESTVQNLKRNVAINEKNYMNYAGKYEDARLSVVMNRLKMSNISVIEPAAAPVKPIKPKKKIYLLAGALAGVVAGLGFAFLADAMAQSFSDPESVEKYLGYPVLATLPCKELSVRERD